MNVTKMSHRLAAYIVVYTAFNFKIKVCVYGGGGGGSVKGSNCFTFSNRISADHGGGGGGGIAELLNTIQSNFISYRGCRYTEKPCFYVKLIDLVQLLQPHALTVSVMQKKSRSV